MSTRTFDIGDRPKYTATFRQASDDALTDPATVTFVWRTAAGVETSYVYGTNTEVAKTSTGIYTFSPPTAAVQGKHVARVKSTTPDTAAELAVSVRRSAFTTP